MDLASFLEALPAAQLDSVYASQVRHRHSRVPSQLRHDAAALPAASCLAGADSASEQ